MHKLTSACASALKLRTIQVSFILSLCLWPGERISIAQQGQITIGPNIHVSKAHREMAHNEVLLSADPLNPSRLIGCTMAFSPKQNKILTIVYVSADGGKNWDFVLTNDRGMGNP
jgi:hypothetical protein